jgi:hypothetical protein
VAAGGNIGDDHPEILAALDRETLNGILAQPESEDGWIPCSRKPRGGIDAGGMRDVAAPDWESDPKTGGRILQVRSCYSFVMLI